MFLERLEGKTKGMQEKADKAGCGTGRFRNGAKIIFK
jgi:hypothetical protein